MKNTICLIGFLTLAACASGPNPDRPPDYRKIYGLTAENLPNMTWEEVRMFYVNAIELPMVRLLANPEEFDGKAVTTCGIYSNEFEGTAIYLNRESYEYGFSANAIFAFTTHTGDALLEQMEGHYVCMTGVYEAESASRLFRASGHLRDIAPLRMSNMRLPSRRAASDPYPEAENQNRP